MTDHRYRGRRTVGRRTGASSGRLWFQLVFLVAALVVLLFFMSQIGERSAGCFARLTAPTASDTAQSGPEADAGASTSGHDAPAQAGQTRVRVPGSPPDALPGDP